jgi:hypothetical protein
VEETGKAGRREYSAWPFYSIREIPGRAGIMGSRLMTVVSGRMAHKESQG